MKKTYIVYSDENSNKLIYQVFILPININEENENKYFDLKARLTRKGQSYLIISGKLIKDMNTI